jgi:hypothetical protein
MGFFLRLGFGFYGVRQPAMGIGEQWHKPSIFVERRQQFFLRHPEDENSHEERRGMKS